MLSGFLFSVLMVDISSSPDLEEFEISDIVPSFMALIQDMP
jgi:hypothetical protein